MRRLEDEVLGRVCTVCKEWKQWSEFGNNKGKKYGKENLCKACKKKVDRKYYENNKEKIAKTNSEYQKMHPEVKKKAQKNYRDSHPEELRISKKIYQTNNKETIRGKAKIYRKNNSVKRNEYQREYMKKHPDKSSVYTKTYYAKNHEKCLESSRMFRLNNPEKTAEMRRRYAKEHPFDSSFRCARRRAMKQNAEGSHTRQEWLLLCEKYDNKCLCCGNKTDLTEDHIVPITKGGSDYISNIQPLCRSCNSSKHTKTIDYRPILESTQ